MKVYEFGTEQEKNFAIFQCAAEPWWVFEASAKELAREYHVYADVQLIDTTRGLFMNRTEAVLLDLGGSTLLVGRK